MAELPEVFRDLLRELSHVPPNDTADSGLATQRRGQLEEIKPRIREALRQPRNEVAIAAALERVNGTAGDARSFDRLHEVLEAQAYRLGVLARIGGGDQLPAILRCERSGRAADGKSGGICGDALFDSQNACGEAGNWAAGRSLRRDVQSAAIFDLACNCWLYREPCRGEEAMAARWLRAGLKAEIRELAWV